MKGKCIGLFLVILAMLVGLTAWRRRRPVIPERPPAVKTRS